MTTRQRHGIEHTHRPGHRQVVVWTCECGVTGSGQTITAGYRSAAEHIEQRRAARHTEKSRSVANPPPNDLSQILRDIVNQNRWAR